MTTESTNATQSDPVPSMETYNENARHLQGLRYFTYYFNCLKPSLKANKDRIAVN